MNAKTPPNGQLATDAETPELIKAKIISETARIHWPQLQKFFAAGSVVTVSAEHDLVEVAYAFSADDKTQVANWLAAGTVGRTTEQQAQQWFDNNTELWAVVISPWVLVQDKPTQLN
ncbi:DUF2288 domain-containing protein [Arsukibacterium indicum]|uniref:DUF2288 domain-containing protein n=1 Tax=Arsukibacterium indicum TaxID=2848612 RepID=A0ABS6MK70_9GAMM|nr:DUF2288 domain-containing protein [Arsukibacterium indicum]MBV2129207.1 DUF2288 domain-containing protein [Arsukibacterium indicum]